MKKVRAKITDFINEGNTIYVHYVKGKDYFCLFTNIENDLNLLKKLYRSEKFEIEEGIYIFDWYLTRKDYFPLGTELDPNTFDVFEISSYKEKESYRRLAKRIDSLWEKILNYGRNNDD